MAIASCPPGSICWTGAAGNGKWETLANWSGPISDDVDVIISLPFSGLPVITVSSAPTISGLTVSKGVTLVCGDSCKLTVERGDATLSNSGSIMNSGNITVEGGSARFSNEGTITNSGTITVEGGSAQIKNFASITNSGSISVVGGGAQIINSGRITNSGSISVEGGGAEITNGEEIFNCDGGRTTGEITGNAVVNGCPSDQTMSSTTAPTTAKTAETTSPATTYVTMETGLTTITSIFTRTTQVSSTQHNYYPVSTATVIRTVTNDVESLQTFIVPPATSETCYWHHTQYSHVKGQRILGSVSSSPSTYFFVMNAGQFNVHRSAEVEGRSCSSYRPTALVSAISISSYDLELVVPEDDDYHYVFYNPSAELAIVTFRLWTEEAQTITSVLSGTRTLVSEYTTTQTLSSVYSTKTGEPLSTSGLSNIGAAVGAIVAVILGATAMVVFYRRKKHT